MMIPAVAAFFKFKIVSSILILACGNKYKQMHLVRQLSLQGMRATISCDTAVLDQERNSLQGVLYFNRPNDTLLDKTRLEHFSVWNKWLIIGDEVPSRLNRVRYDADIAILKTQQESTGYIDAANDTSVAYQDSLFFEDVYVHLRDGVSLHPWAVWTPSGFHPWQERERIQRRLNLKRYPMRISTPVGHYDESSYDGTFAEYVVDNRQPERESAIRCGYGASSLILEYLRVDHHDDSWYDGTFAEYVANNRQPERESTIRCGYGASSLILEYLRAEEVLTQVELWGTEVGNSSMITRLADGTSELSGGVLRLQIKRLSKLDYIIPIWTFKVGFTYVSERESSSNMFVMPFTGATWAACAAITLVLMLAQRATAKADSEKEGAFVAVLATWLQQDASAVPENASGRLTFIVLSVCSMLVYAYYTSAIVSALMSAGVGGPTTLRALADSRYSLASEDYEWIRYQMFDVFKPDWPDMEYLKRKKLASMANFYMDTEAGMQLVKAGTTAYHAEYNHVYPLMKILSDDQVCKLQYVHTVAPVMAWLITTRRGQWTGILRTGGVWLLETGLAKRMVSRWQVRPPPCRAALLAERVSYGDVAPLIIITFVGFIASVGILFVERSLAKLRAKKRARSFGSENTREEEMID